MRTIHSDSDERFERAMTPHLLCLLLFLLASAIVIYRERHPPRDISFIPDEFSDLKDVPPLVALEDLNLESTKMGDERLEREERMGHHHFTCPGSPAWMHAKCVNSFKIADFQCRDVKEEVERRMLGKDNWIDAKTRPGKYVLLASTKNATYGTRTTGDGKYTDKFTLAYVDVPGTGCTVNGCSESQVTSAYDYCTNYCNMFNLLCGTDEGCKVSRHNMKKIQDEASWCPFRDRTMCKR